eukprot:CAMPEP_0184315948 /NCGR_PEP_ID=MMETSP1049-20130417/86882_1 /TAXON_ID=77928 /ORGANISM="Proteomonas sulcata, Strain CCMP704" /LENGTH=101 /DNA_ID=CAMNT_0026634705 /DNA_START=33 /DNA_END=334 /DNA_ORIENTATION=-
MASLVAPSPPSPQRGNKLRIAMASGALVLAGALVLMVVQTPEGPAASTLLGVGIGVSGQKIVPPARVHFDKQIMDSAISHIAQAQHPKVASAVASAVASKA